MSPDIGVWKFVCPMMSPDIGVWKIVCPMVAKLRFRGLKVDTPAIECGIHHGGAAGQSSPRQWGQQC
eukprot:8725070-Lingulodinium_polyedra.AAC.1